MRHLTITFLALMLLSFTAYGQGEPKTPGKAMDKFEEFKRKEKFTPDNTIHYPGVADPALKPTLTEKINSAASDFQKLAGSESATSKDYQDKIERGLQRFSDIYIRLDTEDRERICHYFEELMDIVGLESSGSHLNKSCTGLTRQRNSSNICNRTSLRVALTVAPVHPVL